MLQTSNIHVAVAAPGEVMATLDALKASPATARAKAKFVLATDGDTLEAEDLTNGETVACAYADFPNYFGFFLQLAGITTVKQVRESSFDIRATGRLNRLYRTLLEENPDWDAAERRPEPFHGAADFLLLCEDTDIFNGTSLFLVSRPVSAIHCIPRGLGHQMVLDAVGPVGRHGPFSTLTAAPASTSPKGEAIAIGGFLTDDPSFQVLAFRRPTVSIAYPCQDVQHARPTPQPAFR